MIGDHLTPAQGATLMIKSDINVIIYAFGLTWLSVLSGPRAAVVGGLYPFIPGDILKIFLAAAMLDSDPM